MGRVQVMSETLTSQVAAGEVIERPASVIKELLENSLDAGAKKIEIDIQRGGVLLIRVRDDGSGMSPEDARMAVERHATSKLRDAEGLNTIATLGFRGEALPSIASVSRFTLTTREASAVEATQVKVEGGNSPETRADGGPVGTCIEVRDLFFNVPARRKFLKAEATESAHIDHQVRLHALGNPEVGFVLRRDGRVVLNLPATTDRRVRIESMSGSEAARALKSIPLTERRGLRVEGAILPKGFARSGRRHQAIFLNGRPIEDQIISRALRDAFGGELGKGEHPSAWLWLQLDPREVDVNVHPAKREVRFRNPAAIRQALIEAVENALRPPPPPKPSISTPETPTLSPEKSSSASPDPNLQPAPWRSETQKELPHSESENLPLAPKVGRPNFKILGQLKDRYVILEGDEGLVLFEPRAARERVTYERLLERGEISSQGLLVPILLELDAHDLAVITGYRPHFAEAGFTLEEFGGRTLRVGAVPAFLERGDTRPFLTGLIDRLTAREGLGSSKKLAYEGFAAQVARASIRDSRWELSGIEALLDELFQCDLPYCDPTGRPTLIQISYQELDKKFGKS